MMENPNSNTSSFGQDLYDLLYAFHNYKDYLDKYNKTQLQLWRGKWGSMESLEKDVEKDKETKKELDRYEQEYKESYTKLSSKMDNGGLRSIYETLTYPL